ncbi:MAG: family 16 glycosylhydrolase [Candidatus Saganbacteria bacterium]|nr:family 16 glycosylhydrolase [Candidatus Saganbacteria bacterium]
MNISVIDRIYSVFFSSPLSACNPSAGETRTAQAAPDDPTPAPVTASADPPPQATADALITWDAQTAQEMNQHEGGNWHMANWSNGNPFDCTWQPDNISFNDGIMTLTLDNKGCPASCNSEPYASGEYRTMQETYGYGYYETSMKAAAGEGLVSAFFVYTGVHSQPSHQEIDFEILGKDCTQVQTNYFSGVRDREKEEQGLYEEKIDLGFNACEEFHNYGFMWAADSLVWYIDGQPARTVSQADGASIPHGKTKIMLNLWPGRGVDGWLGQFEYPGQPITAQYDWIRYSPLTDFVEGAGPPSVEGPTSKPPTAPISKEVPPTPATEGTLLVSSFAGGSFNFNGGLFAKKTAEHYTFSASQAGDAGGGIFCSNQDIAAHSTLKFEIDGSVTQHGNWTRLIVQVYDDGDSNSAPSVSFDPIIVSADQQTIEVPLHSQVDNLAKIQFMLVADSGSCNVDIYNLRFE